MFALPPAKNVRARSAAIDALLGQRGTVLENATSLDSPTLQPHLASKGQRLIDMAVKSVVVGALTITPLASGIADDGVSTGLEIAAFGLVALWMVQLITNKRHRSLATPLRITIPLSGLVILIGLQVVPLPPSLLGSISPGTFRLYSRSLHGWPESTPYGALVVNIAGRSNEARHPVVTVLGNWRTISLAPSVTRSALLLFLCYVSIFFVILCYPFSGYESSITEQRFRRVMVIAVLGSGFVAAFIALTMWSAQTVNAKAIEVIRAAGTLGNPDHFACFMSMIFPVALACTIFRSDLTPERWSLAFRGLAGATSFVTMASLLVSGSRSGWIGTSIGTTALLVSMRSHAQTRSHDWVLRTRRLVVFVAIVLVLIMFIGSRGQQGIIQRLDEMTADPTLVGRVGVWTDSLRMIKEFPLFGVGLGCWSEIFPHFESPPWPADSYWAQPHNDYLQILSEIGLIGFVIGGWLLLRLFRPALQAMQKLDIRTNPLLAGTVGAVAAVSIEECVDFGLQLTANALMLTVLLALSLRTVEHSCSERNRSELRQGSVFAAATIALVAFILGIAAVVRPVNARSFDSKTPSQARSFVLAHPAQVEGHISLLEQFGDSMAHESFRAEVETALWLDPTNPYVRDLHALVLMRRRDRQRALAEVRKSLLYSPMLSAHTFLFSDNSHLASLPDDEKDAIEAGLTEATHRAYQDSAQNLGDFYNAIGQPDRAAATYDAAATIDSDGLQKSALLIEAGQSAIAAKDLEKAQAEFEKAISASPHSAAGYEQLIDLMFRIKAVAAAQKVADRAAANRVDPAAFYVQLARGERDLGYFKPAEVNAAKAIDSHPGDPEAVQVLGSIYFAENRFSKAAEAFQRLCELTPNAAQAFFDLGTAEQADYQWFAAEKAFQHALVLDPKNSEYKAAYNQFESKLARNKMDALAKRGTGVSSAGINRSAIDGDAE